MQLNLFSADYQIRALHPFWDLSPMQKINHRAYLVWSYNIGPESRAMHGIQYFFIGSDDYGKTVNRCSTVRIADLLKLSRH